MKKISITGGKGGTGKSTYSILLANRLVDKGNKVILCDCDVECPNDYLLLEESLENKVKISYAQYPILDKPKCTKCGLCAQVCKENAIFQPPNDYPKFFPELCSGCGACWSVCPYGAIKLRNSSIGRVFLNKMSSNFWLVTGSSNPALEETSPIVEDAKEYSLDLAQKNKVDYIIFDSAAGTHCTVIRALLNSEFSYVVTEPTPLGVHNLEIILDLLKRLKVKGKVILNKSDLGNKQNIQNIVTKYNTEIAEEIPYSEDLVTKYSKGKLSNFKLCGRE